MGLKCYIFSFFLRSIWSSIIAILCLFGILIVENNLTGNNYNMEPRRKMLISAYFGLTMVMEIISFFLYLILLIYQAKKKELSNLNKFDCRSTCFLNFFRLSYTITLSIFILVSDVPQKRNIIETMEWKIILAIVYALMSIQILTILSVLIGLLYEPDNFKKPESFNTKNHQFSKVIFEDTSQDLVTK